MLWVLPVVGEVRVELASADFFLNLDTATADDVGATAPTLGMIDGALNAISTAFSSSELNAGGDFMAGTGTFADELGAKDPTNNNLYRAGLLLQGIGE